MKSKVTKFTSSDDLRSPRDKAKSKVDKLSGSGASARVDAALDSAFKKGVDIAPASTVNSSKLPDSPATATATARKGRIMTLEFVRSTAERKDPRLVIYNFADGRPGSVQFLRTAFPEQIPDQISMEGEFAEKVDRRTETPEERKARLASLPKLTPAQKLEKAEARVAALRAKVQAATAQTESAGV